MATIISGQVLIQGLPILSRIKFPLIDASGNPVTGKTGAGLTIYHARNGELPPALITPAIAEISAANQPGWYEMTLTTASLDRPGPLLIRVTDNGAVAVPTEIISTVLSRTAVLVP